MPIGEVVLARGWVWFALFPSALTQLTATHDGTGEDENGDAQRDTNDDGQPVVENNLLGIPLLQSPHARALSVQVL